MVNDSSLRLRLKQNLQELRRRAREALAAELPGRSPDISATVVGDDSVRIAEDLPVVPGPDLIIPLLMQQEPWQCERRESQDGSLAHPGYIPLMMQQEPCQCGSRDGAPAKPDSVPIERPASVQATISNATQHSTDNGMDLMLTVSSGLSPGLLLNAGEHHGYPQGESPACTDSVMKSMTVSYPASDLRHPTSGLAPIKGDMADVLQLLNSL